MSFGPLFLIAIASLGLVGLWGFHWIAALVVRSRGGFGEPLTGKEWIAWMILPALLFGGYAAARLRIPLRLRFAMSRAAFEEYLSSARAGDPPPDRLGLYRIRSVDEYEFGTLIGTTDAPGLFDMGDAGFVRLPGGPPSGPSTIVFRHLMGDWYTYWFQD